MMVIRCWCLINMVSVLQQVVWVKLDGTLLHIVQGKMGQGAAVPHTVQGYVGARCCCTTHCTG